MAVPWLKGIVTDPGGVRRGFPALAADGVVREGNRIVHKREVIHDHIPSRLGVWTEPPPIHACVGSFVCHLETSNTIVDADNTFPGRLDGRLNGLLVRALAIIERRTPLKESFVVGIPGGSERTGELDLGNPLSGGVQVLGGVFSINVGEEVWRFDRVVSSAGLNGAVYSEDWKSFDETMTGESK